MGYTTKFEGCFLLDDMPFSNAEAAYLKAFASTRRMKRDVAKLPSLDWVRAAVSLPAGVDGGYFVGGTGFHGQDHTPDIIDYNQPPSGQPGLWCQWVPSEDNQGIEWNGAEKFYDYVGWLRYIIEHFLKPWGYVLNGTVTWAGEEAGDIGKIIVKKNVVKAMQGKVVYKEMK